MLDRMKVPTNCLMIAAVAALGLCVSEAKAQKLREDFEDVTGSGGGVFFFGPGFGDTEGLGWDEGLAAESAFGNTEGNVHADFAADGVPTGGVDGSGGGMLSITNVNLNLLDDDLHTLLGDGPVTVLQGDGVKANTSGFILNWDGGIGNEAAFGGTSGGAILVGNITAEGCLGCGLAGGEGAEIKVNNVNTNGPGNWFGGLWWDVPGFPPGSGPLLFNAGLDRNGGTLEPWIGTGNVSSAPTTPRSGTSVLKMFGQFTGAANTTLAFQDVAPAANGQTWELECYVRHNDTTGDPTGDFLREGNLSDMKIVFLDAGDNVINSTGVRILDQNDPRDVWIHRGPISAVAGAGTVKARAVFTFTQPGVGQGATLIDDISFTQVGADNSAFLSQFEVSAFVKGAANGGAGEFLGDVQIRVEDTDGDRLAFSEQASVAFNEVGGTLDTFTDQDSNGINSNGAFNPASDSFRVVVAFDNDTSPAPSWGTGGTLTVDDLLMSNTNSFSADDYVAALTWEGVLSLGVENMDKLFLRADIAGSVVGGNYQLRVEGFNTIPELNEDFESITSNAINLLAGPGGGGGQTTNWNDELAYDAAIFGLAGGVVTIDGFARARACTDCGKSGTSGAELRVDEVAPDADGKWWAAFLWENRTLGSDQLGNITLEADMQGDWSAALLESPVAYMLRIEDPDGDFLGFEGVFATSNAWETVGGPLSGFNTNGTVGGSDSVFDIDTNGAEYKVVAIFVGLGADFDNFPFGNWGGTLRVDNVKLTPGGAPARVQSGFVGYEGIATGAMQSVGGLLSAADLSTFIGEGGEFWNEAVQNWGIPTWDSGLIGEDAFAGFWGAGQLGTAAAQGCTDCGTNGTGGAMFNWTGSGTTGSGGWWVGVAWRETFAFTALNQVRLRGDFKASWDTGAGQSPAFILYKLESAPNVLREFRIAAEPTTNGWYHVDDTLDNGDIGFSGDIVFDGTDRDYSLVVSTFGIDAPKDWGSGGTVFIDDLELIVNGVTILEEDFETAVGPTVTALRNSEKNVLDEYTVVVSMEQGIDTWGPAGGTLTVDNLQLALAASCDVDTDLDLEDFAAFQRCMGGDGSGACECADTDADGDVDAADYEVFSRFLDGPG